MTVPGNAESPACPRWGDMGHNYIVIKGFWPWRRYRVCAACRYKERIR